MPCALYGAQGRCNTFALLHKNSKKEPASADAGSLGEEGFTTKVERLVRNRCYIYITSKAVRRPQLLSSSISGTTCVMG
jgi:hypothetical protein